jgi:hypothetical protein
LNSPQLKSQFCYLIAKLTAALQHDHYNQALHACTVGTHPRSAAIKFSELRKLTLP